MPPYGGATKEGEYRRSIELVEEIVKNQGLYYGLALIYDMQYSRDDIKRMMDIMEANAQRRGVKL